MHRYFAATKLYLGCLVVSVLDSHEVFTPGLGSDSALGCLWPCQWRWVNVPSRRLCWLWSADGWSAHMGSCCATTGCPPVELFFHLGTEIINYLYICKSHAKCWTQLKPTTIWGFLNINIIHIYIYSYTRLPAQVKYNRAMNLLCSVGFLASLQAVPWVGIYPVLLSLTWFQMVTCKTAYLPPIMGYQVFNGI